MATINKDDIAYYKSCPFESCNLCSANIQSRCKTLDILLSQVLPSSCDRCSENCILPSSARSSSHCLNILILSDKYMLCSNLLIQSQ